MLAHAYAIELIWFLIVLYTVYLKALIVYECELDIKAKTNQAGINQFVATSNVKTEFYRLLVNVILLYFMILALRYPPPANSGEFLDPNQVSGIRLVLLVYVTGNMLAVRNYYYTRRKTQAYVDNDKTVQSVRSGPDSKAS